VLRNNAFMKKFVPPATIQNYTYKFLKEITPHLFALSPHTLHINTAQIKECLRLAFLEIKIWLNRSQ